MCEYALAGGREAFWMQQYRSRLIVETPLCMGC